MEKANVSPEQAAQIIEREKSERLQEFVKDIQAAMDKHKCALTVRIVIENNQISSEIHPVVQ
jgi:hypothetical protein